MNMIKINSIIIVGQGISGWSLANALCSQKHLSIKIIGKSSPNFGAQQLSPNGLYSLKNLLNNDKIINYIEEVNNLRFSLIQKDQVVTLANYQLNENDNFYGSISRNLLINNLKKTALIHDNVSLILIPGFHAIVKKNIFS